MSLLTDLQAAGLPVLYATDGYNAMFNRELTDAENEIYLNILFPFRQAQKLRKANAINEAALATEFKILTPAQAVAYIETNVTTLASAKAVLKIMARILIAMRDKTWPDLPEG